MDVDVAVNVLLVNVVFPVTDPPFDAGELQLQRTIQIPITIAPNVFIVFSCYFLLYFYSLLLISVKFTKTSSVFKICMIVGDLI